MGLITVVFGYEKPTTRNAESLELLRYGYANYKLEKVVEKDKVVDSVDHILFKNRINVVVKEDIYHLTKKSDSFTYDIKYEYEIQDNACNGKVLVYLKEQKIAEGMLVSYETIERRNFWELLLSITQRCFL